MTQELANLDGQKPRIINPFDINATVEKIDLIVGELIDEAVSIVDSTVTRAIRRRELDHAIRGVLLLRDSLERSMPVAETMPDVVMLSIEGTRSEFTALLKVINPAAPDEQIVTIVTNTLDAFKQRIVVPKAEPVSAGKPEKRKRQSSE